MIFLRPGITALLEDTVYETVIQDLQMCSCLKQINRANRLYSSCSSRFIVNIKCCRCTQKKVHETEKI